MTTETVPTLAMPALPRQFALVLDEDDPDYEEYVTCCQPRDRVVWWGAQVDGRAVLYRADPSGRMHYSRCADVDRAVALWSHVYPLKLEWL